MGLYPTHDVPQSVSTPQTVLTRTFADLSSRKLCTDLHGASDAACEKHGPDIVLLSMFGEILVALFTIVEIIETGVIAFWTLHTNHREHK